MMKMSKELVGLSGEYAVASELCRRGVYAQLTLGHHKRTDLLVLVDFAVGEGLQPDFYVLNLEDWKNLLRLEKERLLQVQVDEKLTIRYPDGWKGLNVRPAMVSQHKDCWQKITEKMGQQAAPADARRAAE